LEKGVVVDGKIVNLKEFVGKLATIKSNFDSSFVFFTIPDELAFVFQVLVPLSGGGNIAESIAFTIEENVPLTLSDTVFDFSPIGIIKNESGYQAEVVVAACVKNEVEKFIEALRDSGFEPIGCIHESQAIVNAVLPKNTTGLSCIVHARRDRIGIYLVKNNIVNFATIRNISSGDYKNQFLDEYEKFSEYSLRYSPDNKPVIKNVLVCGEFESAKKVAESFMEGEGAMKDAKLSNVWSNLFRIENYTPAIGFEDSLNFAGPIGSVLSDVV
jgi:acylphosphatase